MYFFLDYFYFAFICFMCIYGNMYVHTYVCMWLLYMVVVFLFVLSLLLYMFVCMFVMLVLVGHRLLNLSLFKCLYFVVSSSFFLYDFFLKRKMFVFVIVSYKRILPLYGFLLFFFFCCCSKASCYNIFTHKSLFCF